MEQKNLEGRVAIITGGGSGIGAASAARLARAGAGVMIADINLEAAQAVADRLTGEGLAVRAVQADIASEDDVRAVVDATIREFGQIDIMDNNAANGAPDVWGRDRTVVDLDVEVWDRTFNVNVRGAMLFCKHVIPHMLKRGQGGSIINISSGASEVGNPHLMTAYGASKGALNSLTLYVAEQFGRQQIRCNALLCGIVLSQGLKNLFPAEAIEAMESRSTLGQGSQPEDVAAVVHFFAGDDSRQITGKLFRL